MFSGISSMEENAPGQIKMRVSESFKGKKTTVSISKHACLWLTVLCLSLYFYHLKVLCLKLLNYERFWLQSWKLLKFFRVCDIKVQDQMAPKFSEKHIMQISSAIMSKPVTPHMPVSPFSFPLAANINGGGLSGLTQKKEPDFWLSFNHQQK